MGLIADIQQKFIEKINIKIENELKARLAELKIDIDQLPRNARFPMLHIEHDGNFRRYYLNDFTFEGKLIMTVRFPDFPTFNENKINYTLEIF